MSAPVNTRLLNAVKAASERIKGTGNTSDNKSYREIRPLHPAQQAIAASSARFRVLACGRRFGKTSYAVEELARVALTGQPVAYFSQTYKAVIEVWRELRAHLARHTERASEQEKRIDLKGGGVIECWSLDSPDSPLGRNYALIVFDEAAIHRSADTWPRVIRPLLTDRKGRALFLSTPRGKNWFWELYAKGLDPLQTEWASFQYPTTANPFIDPAEVESARLDMPDRLFRQEYLAEFQDGDSGVFRGVQALSTLTRQGRVDGHKYAFGVDWGKAHDYTAISVLDLTTGEQVALDRFNQIDWSLQRGRVRALFDEYQPSVIWAEKNSIGDPNIEELRREGLPVKAFQTTAQTKKTLIERLALAFEQRTVKLLADPVQVHELESFEMRQSSAGNWQYSAPDGGHDDTVIALALSVWATYAPTKAWFA